MIPYHPSNGKQIVAILKTMSKKQEYKIKTFLKKILNGKIPLNDAQYRKLSKHKIFIRSLSTEQFRVKNLMRNYNALGEIISLMLTINKNESCRKNYFCTFRRVAEITSSKNEEGKRRKCNKNQSGRKEEKETDYSSEEDFFKSESYTETSSGGDEEMEEESSSDKSTEGSSDYKAEEEKEEESEEDNERRGE